MMALNYALSSNSNHNYVLKCLHITHQMFYIYKNIQITSQYSAEEIASV